MDEDRKIESRRTPGYFRSVADISEEYWYLFDGGESLPSARDLPESEREESREYLALWCVAFCAEWSISIPPWAAEIFARGWESFEHYEAASLTLALGLPDRKRLAARRNVSRVGAAAHEAFELHHAQSMPLKAGPSGPGAFAVAAGYYSVSPSYVQQAYYRLVKEAQAAGELDLLIEMVKEDPCKPAE